MKHTSKYNGMNKVKQIVSSALAVVGLLLVVAWSENLGVVIATKVAAGVLLYIAGRLAGFRNIFKEA